MTCGYSLYMGVLLAADLLMTIELTCGYSLYMGVLLVEPQPPLGGEEAFPPDQGDSQR
jgi:hypothetical protein